MNREDFYSDRRKERKINFLGDYWVVNKYIITKYGVSRAEFAMVCKMHAMGTFLKADFDSIQGVFPWDHRRWKKMYGPWVERYRTRKPSAGRMYNIYTITHEAKRMVEECYQILCGEKNIPEENRFNKIMKEEVYSHKKYAEAIRSFNKERNKKE